jgi:hypothetical protein
MPRSGFKSLRPIHCYRREGARTIRDREDARAKAHADRSTPVGIPVAAAAIARPASAAAVETFCLGWQW